MLERQPPVTYVTSRQHGPLHGALTVALILWAIAYPLLLVLLASLGVIGWVLGLGAAILLFVPWISGLVIIGFLRWLS